MGHGNSPVQPTVHGVEGRDGGGVEGRVARANRGRDFGWGVLPVTRDGGGVCHHSTQHSCKRCIGSRSLQYTGGGGGGSNHMPRTGRQGSAKNVAEAFVTFAKVRRHSRCPRAPGHCAPVDVERRTVVPKASRRIRLQQQPQWQPPRLACGG
jgi:hypothetical protein